MSRALATGRRAGCCRNEFSLGNLTGGCSRLHKLNVVSTRWRFYRVVLEDDCVITHSAPVFAGSKYGCPRDVARLMP